MSVGQHDNRVYLCVTPSQARMLIDLMIQGMNFYADHPSHSESVKDLYRTKGGIILNKLKTQLGKYS